MDPIKTVYCTIDKICKKIKFLSNDNESDVLIVTEQLSLLSKKDPILSQVLKNKHIVLQMYDKKVNLHIDIEDNDLIENESEIHVALIERELEVMERGSNAVVDGTNVQVVGIGEEFFFGDGSTAMQLNMFNNSAVREPLSPCENMTVDFGQISSTPQMMVPAKIEKRKATDEGECSKKAKQQKIDNVRYPVSLPKLTPHLKQIYDTGDLVKSSTPFIYFWGSNLLEITDGEPTKNDTDNYAKTIVDAYPELKGGKVPHGIVKFNLQRTMANKKFYAKSNASKVGKTMSGASVVSLKQNDLGTAFGVDDALKELKKCKFNDESNHVGRLLEVTFSYRRNFIENEAKDVNEIFENFPQFRRYKFVMNEIFLMKKLKEETLISAAEKMIENLGIHFELSLSVETEKLAILTKLEDALNTKKHRKLNEPLLTIQEAGISTVETVSAGSTSPRVVSYTSDDVLASSFIIAGKNLWLKVPTPTAAKTIMCLLVAYYAWDVKYPPAYRKMLTFLDHVILGNNKHSEIVVHKLIREVESSVRD